MTIATVSKKDIVKEKILSSIVNRQFMAGHKLASESELATQFGVSRCTVRYALDDLTRKGMLERLRGSGTYVRDCQPNALNLKIPTHIPEKILFKHLWGKLLECAHKYPGQVNCRQLPFTPPETSWDLRKTLIKLFNASEPAGIYEITMNELDWLAEAGLCEDLTPKFSNWSQTDNLFPVALEAVTHNKRIFGLPFHCTLSSLGFNRGVFDRKGINPESTVGSVDEFLRTVEKFALDSDLKFTFCAGPIRFFLMHLLRAFYGDLRARFSVPGALPIERETGVEVLRILHRLRWKLRAAMGTLGIGEAWEMFITDLATGAVPMGLTNLLPKAVFNSPGLSKDEGVGFVPFIFRPRGRPFSLFNSTLWIINPKTDESVREFLWNFLAQYVHPRSEYELDRRHLEDGQINARTNSFIRPEPRVPDDPGYERCREELFRCAEKEIPFPSPMFDHFLFAAHRVLRDRDAVPEREFDFYAALTEQNPNGIPDPMFEGRLEN